MILTGKAKQYFEKWCIKKKNWVLDVHDRLYCSDIYLPFQDLYYAMRYGIITEWLDDNDLLIMIYPENKNIWIVEILSEDIMSPWYRHINNNAPNFNTRQEARNYAISKALEIYNTQGECLNLIKS